MMDMYRVTEKEIIEEDRRFPCPCSGSTDPIVLQDELKLVLAYRVAEQDWKTEFNSAEKIVADENGELWAIIIFKNVSMSLWSSINDEGISNHPLYRSGLKLYSVNNIKKSYLKEFFERDDFVTQHIIFTFHDSTFECVYQEEAKLSIYQVSDSKLLEYINSQFGS